jgi:hypothetical protein
MGLLVLEHDVAAGVGLHQTLSAVRSIDRRRHRASSCICSLGC